MYEEQYNIKELSNGYIVVASVNGDPVTGTMGKGVFVPSLSEAHDMIIDYYETRRAVPRSVQKTTTAPKKVGRPRKNAVPAFGERLQQPEKAKRRVGRPKGSKNKPKMEIPY